MDNEKTIWERLVAIWDDVCVSEGHHYNPDVMEDQIRSIYGEQAARSFRQVHDNRQDYIDKMQSRMTLPKQTLQ